MLSAGGDSGTGEISKRRVDIDLKGHRFGSYAADAPRMSIDVTCETAARCATMLSRASFNESRTDTDNEQIRQANVPDAVLFISLSGALCRVGFGRFVAHENLPVDGE